MINGVILPMRDEILNWLVHDLPIFGLHGQNWMIVVAVVAFSTLGVASLFGQSSAD